MMNHYSDGKPASKKENDPQGLLEFSAATKVFAVLLLCGFGVALLCSLSVTDIWSMHEGRVVCVARNMLQSGDFWEPTINDTVRLEKGPMVYWIVAASGAIRGRLSEFSARLPSVLAGMGCVVITIFIGRTLLNNTTGLIAGLVQICIFVYWRDCRTAELDIYLTFFISLAMLSLCRFYFARSRRTAWVLLFWFAFGCGAASKNVLAVMPALLVCGITGWLLRAKTSPNSSSDPVWDKQQSTASRLWPWHLLGIAIFLALALAWNLSMILRFAEYAPSLWTREVNSVLFKAHSARPVYFYLANIFVWAFPMSVFVPAALLIVFSARFKGHRRQLLFLLLWVVLQVLAYSIWPWSKKKLEYIQPMIPAFALLAGLVWNQLWSRQIPGLFNLGDRVMLCVHSLMLLVCGLTAVGLSILDAWGRWMVAVIGVGLILLGLFGLLIKSYRVSVLLWGTVTASLATMIINFVWFLPQMNEQVSPRIFARRIADFGGQAGQVVIYRPTLEKQYPTVRKLQGIPPLNFYLGYNTAYLSSPAELKSFVNENPSGLIIAADNSLQTLPLKKWRLKVLHKQDIDRAGVPFTSKRLPESWQGPMDEWLRKYAQGEIKYTVLLGR